MARTSAARRSMGRLGVLAALAFALTLVATALAGSTAVPGKALAYDPGNVIGAVHVGENTRYCSTYADLKTELEKQKGKTVTVDMYRDWDKDIITSRLIIPENARVTLKMGGFKIDRGLVPFDDCQDDGEVILVRAGAMLTIDGEHSDRSYAISVFDSTEANRVSRGGFPGGLITGGASTDGAGGIHVNKGATVTLNGVTIAGCRAQKGSAAKVGSVTCGCGGGLYLAGGDTTVNLNNSTITGCYASEDGGGIYADSVGSTTIKMTNSHIDANFAHSDGGGIAYDGKTFTITGDGALVDDGTVATGDGALDNAEATGSTISKNQCAERGGGIMANAGGLTARRIVIQNNRAAQGGALYAAQDSATLDRLIIRYNAASALGGGIYFAPFLHTTFGYTGDSSIVDCRITGNSAGDGAGDDADAHGGGVYVDDYTYLNESRKRVFAGATLVRGNTGGNLVIEGSEWRSKSEIFGLTAGAEVRVIYLQKGEKKRTWELEDANCAQFVHSDQENYQFVFDLEHRFIDRVAKGDVPVATVVEVPSANANDASKAGKDGSQKDVSGKIRTVGAGGGDGDDYDLIRGFASHNNKEELSAFYYSDALFDSDPSKYNEHLATLSLTFAYCGGYMTNAAKDVDGNTYYNKHWGVRQFLADIGCPDQNIYVSELMTVKPGTDSIGVSIGAKELAKASNGSEPGAKTGDILVPVAVRGFGYEAEWVSNVTLGSAAEMDSRGKEAKGFSNAADQVFSEIQRYLKKYGLEEAYMAGKVKFWVTGFSRAGATANLVSKRLVDKIAKDGCSSQVFCYSCEAPKGGTDDAEVPGNDYSCIHNMLNKVDVVPYVAPGQMGFKRYGVDHYIPGTAAGAVKKTVKDVTRGGSGGPAKTTTYADNAVEYTKTEAYNARRTVMKKHLLALAPGMVFYDYFSPMALDFVSTSGFLHKYYDGYTDSNHIEDFVEDFIWLLVQKSDISRDKYAKNSYKLGNSTYPSIQTAAQDLMKIAKGGNGLDGVIGSAGGLQDEIPYVSFFTFFSGPSFISAADFSMAGFYFNVIGEWGKLSDANKVIWTGNLWSAFKKTGALDKMSAEEKEKFEAAFPTLLDVALTVVDSDYNYKPKNNQNNQWAKGSTNSMMYLPTFIEYSSYILQCHDPNVCLAWAESYDSWYNDSDLGRDEKDNFRLALPDSVAAPAAYGTVDGARRALDEGASASNELTGDQRIVLENEDIVGEAVYYDLVDVTDGNKKMAANQLYRGGIDLTLGNATAKTYKITTYDMSYSVPSGTATYKVTLRDDKHTVTVHDLTTDAAGGASATGGTQLGGQGVSSGQGAGDGLGLTAGSIPDGNLLTAASDEARERTRTYTFAEGQNAVVQADEPPSKFFKAWKAKALAASGAETDVTSTLLPESAASNAAASFTMPVMDSTTYPEGYELELTAEYGDRIIKAHVESTASESSEPEPLAPAAGEDLAGKVQVSFASGKSGTYTPTWTYTYTDDGGTTHTVPASGKAYSNTVYHASIHIPDDRANEIMFASRVSVSSGAGTLDATSVTRSADGDITIGITFAATGDEGDTRPDVPIALTVNEIDLNTGAQDPEVNPLMLRTHASTDNASVEVTLTAPDVPNEVFVMWDFTDTGIVVSEDDRFKETVTFTVPKNASNSIAISAQYVPIVQRIDVNLRNGDGSLFAPEGGGPGPASYEMSATISNEYEISPECLELTWAPALPEGGTFGYQTQYTASVKVKFLDGASSGGQQGDSQGGQQDGTQGGQQGKSHKILVRKKGETEYREVNFVIFPAVDMKASFNAPEQEAHVDLENIAVSTTFPETTYVLGAVQQPDSISGVAHDDGVAESQVRAMLPKTTRILTTHGVEFDADIQWESLAKASGGDAYASIVWTARGTVKLPDIVENPDDKVSLKVSMTVSVDDAGTAPTPTVSPEPGTYICNQMATLATTRQSGITTFYTTDGSDPRDVGNPNRKAYAAGEEIHVSRSDANLYDEETGYRMFAIKAYTVADGKRPSDVSEFDYVFFDVFMPEGLQLDYVEGVEQIGVEGSPLYTLTPMDGGARIDEDGNAVATYPGAYTVRAHLNDSADSWQLDGRGGRSHDDQVIQFVIAGETPDGMCAIAAKPQPREGGTVAGGGAYATGSTATLTATANEGYEFVNWTQNGVEISADSSYSFEVSGGRLLQANFDPVLTVRWLDGDGSVLDSKTFREGDDEPTTDVVPVKAADVQHTYTFASWDDGNWDKLKRVKTYEPQFTSAPRKYTVKFVDYDGTVLQSSEVAYGTTPLYMGAAPQRAPTAQYSFLFAGWDKKISPVEGDAVYRATYSQAVNRYTVKFVNWNGAVLQSSRVAYGQVPAYTGKTPKKASTVRRTYTFKGWAPKVKKVTGNVTYKATFRSAKRVYAPPIAKMTATGKDGLTISWKKVPGADGYDIFFSRCNHDDIQITPKKVATVKAGGKLSWTKTGLKPGKSYKARVKAYVVAGGKKVYVRQSPFMHAYAADGTKARTNAKSVTVNRTGVTLKKGKTFQLKVRVAKRDARKVLMLETHTPRLRYLTTDDSIATVTAKGKIKGVGSGTCYVYTYAHNGVWKRVKVVVK